MIKALFLLSLLLVQLYSKNITICSYNVENLFDLENDKSEYKEYKPNEKSKWNKKTFDIKVSNILKVLNDMNCDIVALQEIENEKLIKLLQKKLPKYAYSSFSKFKNASVGLGFLSAIKIVENKTIDVKFSDKLFRPILENTFVVNNIEFKIFNNHWPSKKSNESYRIKYAKTLFDSVNELPRDYDYILLGDFNSNYNEFETIKYDEKLNSTNGITGINQVLNTTLDKKYITYDDILRRDKRVHYNLWLDLEYKDRFSTIFRNNYNTPDNIIVSPALFDNKKMSYVKNSFKIFKPDYLFKNKNIFRWQIKNEIHKGEGFSDHLPIMATFTTDKIKNSIKKDENENKISTLYKKIKLIEPLVIKDAIVIYKSSNNAIIKQKNDRAIFLYNNAKELKEGFSYDIKVLQIKEYFGLKEISEFEILNSNQKEKNYKTMYVDANIDFEDTKYQNEIIQNIEGIYKKRDLFFDNKKVRLYFKDKELEPKDGTNIIIKRAQIGYYKNGVQLVINNKSDIDVN
ncbi:endonuclease/exonuclease/phosphatase family protein [Halarcobacter ebronensis]|uniref:endonuclease/exonuclease/phosphatase family protein n=1 Tax=Halarcobacter ebronensis TaxID=1462615 RepID=UPI00155DACA3|nr:endonuclease/exonuclease/phosphatase family protein [Halarcobacter ebronensis]QKF82449.1 endonuclease/exonuclease/phosphatase [Halarcobacter ebronensis]